MASTRKLLLLVSAVWIAGNLGCQSGPDYGWLSPEGGLSSSNIDDPHADAVRRKNSLLLARATLAEADNKVGEAHRLYEAVLQSDPKNAEALHRLAILHTNQGDFASADRCFHEALQSGPGNAQLHNDYGYFCHLQNNTDEALKHLLRAAALDPDLQTAHTNLGLVYARMGRYSEAESQFRLAGCSRAETHNNIAFTRMMESDFAGAKSSYETALQSDPQLANARRGLGTLNQVLEEVEMASAPPAQDAVAIQSVGYRREPAGEGEMTDEEVAPSLEANHELAGDATAPSDRAAPERTMRISMKTHESSPSTVARPTAAPAPEAAPDQTTLRIRLR